MALPHLAGYEMIRRLGVGGMAETFEAFRVGPGGFKLRVCVKVMLPALSEDPGFVTAFQEEARLWALLAHGNIVQVFNFGIENGEHYLVLELVDGLDLRAVLNLSVDRLDAELVALVAVDLARALEHAHGANGEGVVHRDISPSNVLVNVHGEVKLADFGIARAAGGHGVTHTIKGKVPYMAPEYAREGRFDARSDLFSLGVTLYEALAGARPFDGVSDFDTVQRMLAGEHVPLAERCPDAPPALVTAIERLIAAEPESRFSSAASLLESLDELAPRVATRRRFADLVRTLVARRALVGQARDGSTESLSSAIEAPAVPVASGPDAETRTRGRRAPATSSVSDSELVSDSPAPLASETKDGGARIADAPKRGSRSWVTPALVALLAVVVSVGLGVALWPTEVDPDAPQVAPRSVARVAPPGPPGVEPVDASASVPSAAEEPAAEEPAAEEPAPVVRAAPSRATLEVVVLPDGRVWLDGRLRGASPIVLDVSPGSHRVAGGRESPVHLQEVRVRAGERRTIVLR